MLFGIGKRKKHSGIPQSVEEILGLERKYAEVLASKHLGETADPLRRGINFMWDLAERNPTYPNFTNEIAKDKRYQKFNKRLQNDRKCIKDKEYNEKIDCALLCSYCIGMMKMLLEYLWRLLMIAEAGEYMWNIITMRARVKIHIGFIAKKHEELMADIEEYCKTGGAICKD